MKKQKKSNLNKWLNTQTKKDGFVRKMFAVLFMIYLIYQMGYGIGKFFAHIGF